MAARTREFEYEEAITEKVTEEDEEGQQARVFADE